MGIDTYIALAAGTVAVLVVGMLIHRAGVRQGMLLSKMAWNIQRGEDPLDDLDEGTTDTSPDTGECG